MMKRRSVCRAAVLLAMVGLFGARECGAATVTIEGTEFPAYTLIDDEFAHSAGVLFRSTLPFVTFGIDGHRFGIYGTDRGGNPQYGYASFNSPIEAIFVNPGDGLTPRTIDEVSLVWGDGGGDTDLLRVRAFDLNGQLLATVLDSGIGFNALTVQAPGTHRLIVDQQPGAPTASDTFLDSITFQIPEPGTLLLLTAGMGAVLSRVGRR